MKPRTPLLLVCGFGRCGSSLVMQMLQAGGFPTTGTFPAFEDIRTSEMRPGKPALWLREHRGEAVKLLDPHLHLPDRLPINARAIWLDREPKQQAKSFAKFAREMMGAEVSRSEMKDLQGSIAADRKPTLQRLLEVVGERPLMLRFEEMIRTPRTAAERIARYVDAELNVDRMTNCVLPRSPQCLQGLLEIGLAARGPMP